MTLNLNGHSVDIFGNHIFYFKYWVYILIYSRPWAIPSLTLTQYWTEFRYPLSIQPTYSVLQTSRPAAGRARPPMAGGPPLSQFLTLHSPSSFFFTSSISSFPS